MLQIETNPPIIYHNQPSLLTTGYSPSQNHEQLLNIHPRLCTLRKWAHYDGYGIHLARNEHWLGLNIDEVEPNSPAESAGLLRDDIILAVNGHSVENDDFFAILSFIQHELEQDQIRFLVLDPHSLDLARYYHININENSMNCIPMETQMSHDQWQPNRTMTNSSQNSPHNNLPTFLSHSDSNNNLTSETRLCSVILRPDKNDQIGISLQSDKDFGHIIEQVEPNSPADRAGIERDDCIISLNNTLLLHTPYENVLSFLRKSRNETHLNFLVTKKSNLLDPYQNYTNDEVLPSSNLTERNLPASKTLEQLYQKYNNEQYDRSSPQIESNRYALKEQDVNTTKGRSNSPGDPLKPLRVGITNPSPTGSSDDSQRTSRPIGQQPNYVNNSPSSSKQNQTIKNIINTVPIAPVSSSRIYEQDNFQASQYNFRLATVPISALSDLGYELHDVMLTQPNETIPIGFQLTKRLDSLQYLITVIIEQSRADVAGLKIDDWILQIDNKDIRLIDFHEVSQNMQQLLNTQGFLHLLIARKKFPLLIKHLDEQQNTIYDTSVINLTPETIIPSSVGLSNPIEDKIRHILLKEALGLDFNSFLPDNANQSQVHFISNIQPSSIADKAGLRDGDRILTVNDLDVTNTIHEEVRKMMSNKTPVHLTVVNDPKYLELIEHIKELKNNQKPSNAEPIQQPQPQQQCFVDLPQDLLEYFSSLFVDDKGPVYIKHCILKKHLTYDRFGFLLRNTDNLHVIDNVEKDYPGYNCGLRADDVVLFINNKNVEQMAHDDVKMVFRTLAIANTNINLMLINKNDVERYKNFQETNSIDWKTILSEMSQADTTEQQDFDTNHVSTSAILSGARTCNLKITASRTAGFTISGSDSPPFFIVKIEKDSPAEKAGLQLNDALLSINGKSVIEINYDDTIKLLKEALQQDIIQLAVKQQSLLHQDRKKTNSQSSNGSNITGSIDAEGPSNRGANTVELYQQLRTKELSYSLRLCHLNATTSNGAPPVAFGFELIEDSRYEYPIVSHVEPKLPGELSGLQAGDILLKVNERKTKGLDFDKVKKAIEKAKRDGRLEMLVVDEETFNYCKRTKKLLKEPDMKIKHIFPKSRSAVSFQKLPLIAANPTLTSQDILEQSKISTSPSASLPPHRFSIPEESQYEDKSFPPDSPDSSDEFLPSTPHDKAASSFFPHRTSAISEHSIKQVTTSPRGSNASQKISKQTTSDDSIIKTLSHTFSNIFNSSKQNKSTKPYDNVSPKPTIHSKTRALSSPIGHQRFEELQHVSQSYDTVRSNQSMGSYDYIRDPRRCVLKIDRSRGLGFVLSATGDYDHTITVVEKNSIADAAGLQANDEIVEVDGVDIRNIKYEQVVDMLISAMQANYMIEMYVINSRPHDVYPSTIEADKRINTHNELNDNNNNNNSIDATIHSQHTTAVLSDDISEMNSSISPSDSLSQQRINTSYPNISDRLKYLDNITNRGLSGSVPTLTTGITASPKGFHSIKSIPTSSETNSAIKLWDISKKDAPIARLCRIRKFPSSPLYGFFLCGNSKKLGHVFISNVTKNSPASICGLRDGDCIIEINGINIQTLTYETILDKIKQHMEWNNLDLLVLDKKSLRWYLDRNYTISSRTLPAIVHIQPIMNNIHSEIQSSQSKTVSFADRPVPKTSL